MSSCCTLFVVCLPLGKVVVFSSLVCMGGIIMIAASGSAFIVLSVTVQALSWLLVASKG